MGLRYCTDTAAANWVAESHTPWQRLITLGPAGYEAYARLRFIPDPSRPGQAEADADVPDNHPPDIAQARIALHLLSGFTDTAQDCNFCVWEGYPDLELSPGVPLVELPHRRYALLRGPLTEIDTWAQALGVDGPGPPPAFAWPADRKWCFTSDVDPHWAGIGAERAAIDTLVKNPRLDVVPARPAEVYPAYF